MTNTEFLLTILHQCWFGIPLSIKRSTVVTHVCNFDVFGSCLDIFSSHSFFSLPFNSHEWPGQNFSLQYYTSADLVFLFLLREAQSLHMYATLMFLVKVLVLISFLLTLFSLNPLTPMCDQDRISPYNINTISTRWVMRINENINLGRISWSNPKFLELTL